MPSHDENTKNMVEVESGCPVKTWKGPFTRKELLTNISPKE